MSSLAHWFLDLRARTGWRVFGGALLLALSAPGQARDVRVGVYQNEPKIFMGAQQQPTGILGDLLVAWSQSPDRQHQTITVNVSARQFHQPDFVQEVQHVLLDTGANPQRLELELTESQLLVDVEGVIAKMTALKALGVRFSLDDFGTGYSSLSMLKRLPLDQLKIDQSFVRDVLVDAQDASIIKAIVALGDSLGLAVIAEGVETAEHRDALLALGCTTFQGYFFGRPAPVSR